MALDHIGAGLLLLETHRPNRVGLVSHNLGEVLLRLGRHTEAVDRFEQCLTIRRADRDLYGENITLAALGRAHCLLDQRDKALTVLAEALVHCEATQTGRISGRCCSAGPRSVCGRAIRLRRWPT